MLDISKVTRYIALSDRVLIVDVMVTEKYLGEPSSSYLPYALNDFYAAGSYIGLKHLYLRISAILSHQL